MSQRSILVPLILALAPLATAQAQGVRPEPSVSSPVLGAITLGAVGFFGGALIGHGSSSGCTGEWCDLGSTALGAIIGETIGISAGAHLGNRERGSYSADFATSALVFVAGIALMSGSDDNSALPEFLVVTGGQIAATVAMERTTGRANERKRGLRVSVTPMPHRGVGVVASVPLP